MANEKRLIDANEAMEYAQKVFSDPVLLYAIKTVLDNAPTVDVVEVVHGRWRYYSTTMQECSNCQRRTARHKFKYCPHCGAIMEDKYHE